MIDEQAVLLVPANVLFRRNLILDRLASEGQWSVSEQLETEFLRREQTFFADPSRGESWEFER